MDHPQEVEPCSIGSTPANPSPDHTQKGGARRMTQKSRAWQQFNCLAAVATTQSCLPCTCSVHNIARQMACSSLYTTTGKFGTESFS